MAINVKDMPITREMVYEWLQGYSGTVAADDDELRTFLQGKVTELGLADEEVYLPGSTEGETVHIVDYLMEDIETYV